MKFSPKRFFWSSLIGGILVTIIFGLVNMYLDVYGLHQKVEKKNKRVFYNEGYSKYLMARNYVPNNFDGLLLGPSLSDNFETKNFKALDLYNLSVMGVRASGMKKLLGTVLNNNNSVKLLIFSINPYVTEKGGSAVQVNNQSYYEHFGSYNLIKTYAIEVIQYLNLVPNKYPKNQFDVYGFNNYFDLFKVDDLENRIKTMAQKEKNKPFVVDSVELAKLKGMFDLSKSKNVTCMFYFHPLPKLIYKTNEEAYLKYKNLILQTLDNQNYIDFNEERFDEFTNNNSNYIDHGHLSYLGQKKILEYLDDYVRSGELKP